MLNRGQLDEFAGRGFLVLPRAVPPDVMAAAAEEQVTGEAADLLLAHYLLGHNIGGNTSRAVRRAVYFRIKRAGHDPRWREFLQDPWLDYDAVRERLE